MSAYSAERIMAATEAELTAFYAAGDEVRRAWAAAYRAEARKARIHPFMTREGREAEAARLEAMAAHCLDMIDGEPA